MTSKRRIFACVCAATLSLVSTTNAEARPLARPAGPNSAGMSPNAGAIPAQVLANERVAYTYFLQKGLTAVQSAGIIGNLDVESGVDPTAQQAGGPGRGIAQWSVGGRWDTDASNNMVWFANQHGLSQWNLTAQLDFTWYELTTFSSYGLNALQAATTITAAVTAFQDDFEGCGNCNTSGRISYAQSAYQRYGGGRLATAGASAVGLGTNEVDYFSRSAAGHLVDHPYVPGSGWQAQQDLGSPASGLTWDPDAASSGSSHIDVAARDASGHLAMLSTTNGTWSPWHTFSDITMLSSPSVVDTAPGNVVVLWLGTNHQLVRRVWTATGGWSTVSAVPGVSNCVSGPDAVTWQSGSGHIDVVYRGTDGQLWTVTYDTHWSAPVPANPTHALAATPASVDPGSGTTGSGDFSVYVTTTAGSVYHASGNTLTGVWSPWYAVSGSSHATAAPDTTALPSGGGVYVVTAASGTVVTTSYVGHAWTPWQPA